MDNIIENRKVRKTVFHVLAAALSVAGVWGLLEADQIEEVTKAIVALLGVGGAELAASNVPKSDEKPLEDSEGLGK